MILLHLCNIDKFLKQMIQLKLYNTNLQSDAISTCVSMLQNSIEPGQLRGSLYETRNYLVSRLTWKKRTCTSVLGHALSLQLRKGIMKLMGNIRDGIILEEKDHQLPRYQVIFPGSTLPSTMCR